MRELRYSILADIQDAIERAKQGKLALYWQRTIQREYHCKKTTPAEQQAYEQLQSILSEVPQWSDEEELHHDMENIEGRLWYCHFWIDHNSMVQLTEDFMLPTFWIEKPPRMCVRQRHYRHRKNLWTICRRGVFRF